MECRERQYTTLCLLPCHLIYGSHGMPRRMWGEIEREGEKDGCGGRVQWFGSSLYVMSGVWYMTIYV